MCVMYCEEHNEGKIPPAEVQKRSGSKPPFDYIVSEWFDPADIEVTYKAVRKAEQLLNTRYSLSSRIFLQYYLLFLLSDLRRGMQITRPLPEDTPFREGSAIP